MVQMSCYQTTKLFFNRLLHRSCRWLYCETPRFLVFMMVVLIVWTACREYWATSIFLNSKEARAFHGRHLPLDSAQRVPNLIQKLLWSNGGLGGNPGDMAPGLPLDLKPLISQGRTAQRLALSSVPDGKVPVAIVEEHHDVVNWWFQAVDSGILPRQGNLTLLHIDAHSDFILPIVKESFPLLRYPGKDELKYLMTGNDRFIAASALTGMFNRVIWVVPQWTIEKAKKSHDGKGKDAALVRETGLFRYHVFIGLMTHPSGDPEHQRICYCFVARGSELLRLQEYIGGKHSDNRAAAVSMDKSASLLAALAGGFADQAALTVCFRHKNDEADLEMRFTEPILQHMCQPRYHVLVEFVSEDLALRLVGTKSMDGLSPDFADSYGIDILQHLPGSGQRLNVQNIFQSKDSSQNSSFHWINSHENVLLDIDEDYYGVEPSINFLKRALISVKKSAVLSGLFVELFCASNGREEKAANVIFKTFLVVMYNYALCKENATTCQEDNSGDNVENYDRSLYNMLAAGGPDSILCRRNKVPHHSRTINTLIHQLRSCTSNQLAALARLGICLYRSPNTFSFNHNLGMKLCYDENSLVLYHEPSDSEIRGTTEKLKTILSRGKFTPKAVTIARSVRDGYTVRRNHRKIEDDLLTILKNVYKDQVTDDTIFYDPDLFNGKEGWEGHVADFPMTTKDRK